MTWDPYQTADRYSRLAEADRAQLWAALTPEQQEQLRAALATPARQASYESAGTGCLVQILGAVLTIVGLPLFPVGLLLAIPGVMLVVWGVKLCRRYRCGKCGNRVEWATTICPSCRSPLR